MRLSKAGGADPSWEAEVRRHNRRVLTSLLAQGVPMSDAQDLAQEAWLKIYEKWRSGELDRIELPGIVMRQAAFLAADYRRRAGRSAVQHEESQAADAETRLLAGERLLRARRAFESCSVRAREIFLQAYATEAAHAELAESLGISLQRLRQTLCEVRAKIRRALEDYDE